MTLQAGKRLGSYEILAPLGSGGMGEVYRARDTKLGRDVALKVLPDAVSRNRDRLTRFEREARVLASLNHPNVATLFGFEEADGRHFLAMELVEGETLAECLASGPLPVEEALPLFRQIAEGLEGAHDKGVVHRDLKPANIKITPDGRPKILDFGLAKAMAPEGPAQDLSASPTMTRDVSETGVLLGTAPYMSPEQARGKTVDKKTDIWAFGCCLYEALTGKAAFLGETVSDTIGKIMEREPDWEALPVNVRPLIKSLLRRCLQKDATHRLHDIADARIEIEEASAESPIVEPAAPATLWNRAVIAILFGIVLLLGGFVVLREVSRESSPRPTLSHFTINLEPGQQFSLGAPAVAISPDGSYIAYAAGHGMETQLHVRERDAFEARLMPGTEGAQGPFFSPDSRWVGFYSKRTLFKIPLEGGRPEKISDASYAFLGASWDRDDTIVHAQPLQGLWRVSASGGIAEHLTKPDAERGEQNHGHPQFLPNGDVLFTVSREDGNRLAVLSSAGNGWRYLDALGEAGNARYLTTGHLVHGRADELFAVALASEELEPRGSPVRVFEGVFHRSWSGLSTSHFAISENGTLVYVPSGSNEPGNTLVWVDRDGNESLLSEELGDHRYPRLSPDGRRLAVTKLADTGDIWVYDLELGTESRLTLQSVNVIPVWSPDGARIAFYSERGGVRQPHWKSSDGTGEVEPLRTEGPLAAPHDWSPDGKFLALDQATGRSDVGIWMLSLDRDRKSEPFLDTKFNEQTPRFSPDGRWLAYVSDESGRYEVYVRSFPSGDNKQIVSSDGGTEPVWSRDGRELFYRRGDQMMAVDVSTTSTFSAARPRVLFQGTYEVNQLAVPNYDVSPDGERFVMIRRADGETVGRIHIILDWLEEIERVAPATQ